MPATETTLQLVWSGVTVDLMGSDTNDYQLQEGGYAPQVARRQTSPFGGLTGYQEVEEQLTISVYGTDNADLYANVATLARVIDAAIAWQDTTTPTPAAQTRVELVFQPIGSTQSAPLRAVVTSIQEQPQLPATYHDNLVAAAIDGVQINLTRREFLGAEQTTTATTAATPPTVHSKTFSTTAGSTLSPLMFKLTFSAASGDRTTFPPSFLAFAYTGTNGDIITVVEAETLSTGSAPWSSVADSANNASSTNVLRYTPSGTTTQTTAIVSPSATLQLHRTYAVLATVRSSTTTTTWGIRPVGYELGTTSPAYGDRYELSGTTAAQVVSFGTIRMTTGLYGIALQVDASAASGTLDIDTIALVSIDQPTSSVIAVQETDVQGVGSLMATTVSNGYWWLNTGALVWAQGGGSFNQPLQATGDIGTLSTQSSVSALWLAVDGGTSTKWRPTTTTTALVNGAFAFIRQPAYVTPE